MNQLTMTVIWLIMQISLLCLITAVVYGIARRGNPNAGAATIVTGLLLVAGLTITAFCPWPEWSFAVANQTKTAPGHQDNNHVSTVASSDALGDLDPTGLNSDSANEQSAVGFEYFTALWQELQSSLAEQREIVARESRPSWIGLLVVVVPVGAAIGLIRLIMGLISVRNFRKHSQAVTEPAMRDLVDLLCSEFECRRPIALRESSEIVSAATIGWRRPLVLLPADWTSWSEQERRSVLAHEIAHISNNDFAFWLAAQIGLLLHFYHPLVHWLAGRLRFEQELAADAAAARSAGGSQSYMKTLAKLALRQCEQPFPWPARTFLPTRGTLMRRIEMLRNSRKNTGARSGWRRGAVVSIVLLAGIFVSGLRQPSLETANAEDKPFAQSNDEKQLAQSANQPRKTVRDAKAAQGPKDSFDLRYVPPTTTLMLGVRPSGIATDNATKPMLAMLNQMLKQSNVGLTIDDFQQVLMVGFPTDENDSGQFPEPVLILTTKQPNDFVGLIKGVGGETTDGLHKGAKLRKSKSGQIFHQLDDRTLVLGMEQQVTFLMDVVKGGPGKVLWHRKFAPVAEDQFCAVFEVDPIRTRMELQTKRPQASAVLSAFAPLWRDTRLVVVGAKLIGNTNVHVTAYCESEDGAVKVERTAGSLVPLAKNMIAEAKDKFAKLPREAQGPVSTMIAFMETLLDEVKITRDGRMVSVRADTPGTAIPILVAAILPAIQQARTAAGNAQTRNNLKQIALALHNFHDVNRHFPTAAVLGPDGKTLHSWRVAILPYLGEKQLYEEYKLDEPWDSRHNLKLLKKRPHAYQHRLEVKDANKASYFALTGAETAFGQGDEGVKFREITDGPSKTILVVEAKRDIPWTKPEDIPFHPKGELPKLGGFDPTGFNAALCDGSVRFWRHNAAKDILRALITRSGKESVKLPK